MKKAVFYLLIVKFYRFGILFTLINLDSEEYKKNRMQLYTEFITL
jgi:hypothetical protein